MCWDRYHRNLSCRCARCRVSNTLGAGLLITIGVLFLLDTMGRVGFETSWPVILIFIGAGHLIAWAVPAEGHVQPWWWCRRHGMTADAGSPATPAQG